MNDTIATGSLDRIDRENGGSEQVLLSSLTIIAINTEDSKLTTTDTAYDFRGWRLHHILALVLFMFFAVGCRNGVFFDKYSDSVDIGGIVSSLNMTIDDDGTDGVTKVSIQYHASDLNDAYLIPDHLKYLNSINRPSQAQQPEQESFSEQPPAWHNLATYDLSLSTEMNYRTSIQGAFYGRYAQVRSTLDYSYHSNYIPQRQHLQDSIVHLLINNSNVTRANFDNVIDEKDNEDAMRYGHHDADYHPEFGQDQGSTSTNHWIIFTAGAMGAGKSYTVHHLAKHRRFPLQRFVTVDPDEIRRLLPEFESYLDDKTGSRPEMAGKLTRKEAGMIAEILTEVALREGRNVMVDGSLKDSDWYQRYFDRLRKKYSGKGGRKLKLGILHITAPRDAIIERARTRSQITGRIVPQHTLEETIVKVPESIKVLAPLVDFFAEIRNAPNATDVELVTEGMTWESFRQALEG